jgi:Transcriptional regulators of sugar metabolism
MARAAIGKVEKRHIEIKKRLAANGVVGLGELCDALRCSESTVRNDLSFLEEKGELRRTLGGAIPLGTTHLGHSMAIRSGLCKDEKRSIARFIANEIVNPGHAIILDAGSTNIEIAQAILEADTPISVITNNVPAAAILANANNVDLYLSGGRYLREKCALDGDAFFQTMRADLFFLAVSGIAHDVGYTIPNVEEVTIKHAMIRCSSKTIAVVDHSKLGKTGLKLVCGFDQVKTIVTDDGADAGEAAKIRAQGVEVLVAPAAR